MSAIELSVVIPLFNEEGNIPVLLSRLKASLEGITASYEIILIDDGSRDQTLLLLKQHAEKDQRVRFISFSRNFGHQHALTAGIDHAEGKAVVIMDGDLQDPPELIPELYAKFQEGYEVVYARRKSRKGESAFKKFTAKFFYRMLKRITAISIPIDTGDFRLISRNVVLNLRRMKESNKFYRGQIAWLGFRQTEVKFERDERKSGTTKYPLKRMMRFAMDGITAFSDFPLQIAIFLGFTVSVVAFLIMLYALYSKFILQEVVTGWTSLMISMMFIGGIQLLCLGIIGEYISRIAHDVRQRPSYVIGELSPELSGKDPELAS